ncbi:MAG: GntR family transcriptional regulator [Pseudomonadota bacterium]|nr:GntR family transcriptional regulator [Pseudomonadota bacterium]
MKRNKKPTEGWIYDQVFDAILEQRLLPDTKLTEKDLCDVFGVSRTIIRKVLLRLSLDKVVQHRPNRGSVIAAPDPDEVREIFDARRLLEEGIVEKAARNCSPEDAEALTSIATREQACIQAGQTSGAIRLSGDFHLKLADIAGNRPLRELLRQLVAQTSLAIARYVPVGHGMCDDNDHDRLVVAIANGNIRESQDIMQAHLTACERRLMLGVPEELNNLQAVFAEVVVAE